MTDPKDGGPAFPHLRRYIGEGIYETIGEGGMALRDWFAGQALAGIASQRAKLADPIFEGTAEVAYALADAMLAEREKESDQ